MAFPEVEDPFIEGLMQKVVDIHIPQAPPPTPPHPTKVYWVWRTAGSAFPHPFTVQTPNFFILILSQNAGTSPGAALPPSYVLVGEFFAVGAGGFYTDQGDAAAAVGNITGGIGGGGSPYHVETDEWPLI